MKQHIALVRGFFHFGNVIFHGLGHILDKIMEPFYQGDASRNQEGFGLGLALCRRIAMLHGSDLTVESTPGHGSTFTTLLQLHDDSQTPQPV